MDGIADYVFERSLGAGAHGEHFLARPPSRLEIDVEFVAVTVWATSTTRSSVRSAMTELKHFAAAATVQSQHLVTLFDAGQQDNAFFFSMEYFPRGSLASPLDSVPPSEARRAVADACRATDALHEAGLVHRNIKPGNVMLAATGAKLSDLGLAHVVSPGMTVTSIGRIDPIEFLDPGILAHRERPSRASDIWSLGVTLHSTLTGKCIYGDLPDGDPLLAIRAVLGQRPALDPQLGDDEREIVSACLAEDPRDRPATALDVAVALDRIDAS